MNNNNVHSFFEAWECRFRPIPIKHNDASMPGSAQRHTGWGVWGCPGFIFGLLFLGLGAWRAQAEQVVFSKILAYPHSGKPAYVEIYNLTANLFDIARWRLKGGADYAFPDFSATDPTASFLKPFERIVISSAPAADTRTAYRVSASVRIFGPWQGRLSPNEERLTLLDKNGVTVSTVKYSSRPPWPASTNSPGQALVLIDPDQKVDDWRNWTLSTSPEDIPGTASSPNKTTPIPSPEIEANSGSVLVDYNASWRYHDLGQNLGTAWREPAFDDRAWRVGVGLLGHDNKPVPQPGLRARLNFRGQITYYFRHNFIQRADPQPDHRFILDHILDDGAVFYLNGKEIGRTRIPAGPIHFRTLATSVVPDATEELNVLTLDPRWLVKGTNVLAVEVHQCAAASSDIVFGARLRLTGRPQPSVVINEVGTDAQGVFIEFFNTSDQSDNLKGYHLSDDGNQLRKYTFKTDLILPSRGLAAVSLTECGLGNTRPLSLYLTAPDGQTVFNGLTVNFTADGRAVGRKPDGLSSWFRFAASTRGQPNLDRVRSLPARPGAVQVQHEIVINEIMYDPPYGADETEYVELYNRGSQPVDVSGWRFSEGITFTFPSGTVIPPDGYEVVAANPNRLKMVYGSIPLTGPYQGRLRHGGERIRLVDAASNIVDEVDFKPEGDWPSLAHGGGSSMELIHPGIDNSRSSAWRDSDETGKATWQTYSCTNVYLGFFSGGAPSDYRELHLYLAGEGHIALRNIGLWKDGVNYLDHPDQMSRNGSSATGWLAQGTHWATHMTNGELHVISDGRGDNKVDRIEIDCVRLKPRDRYELRFEARWIAGCPRLIALTWDHSFGGSFLLTRPAKLGTPGQPNSVAPRPPFALAQAAPQLDDLRHAPPVPRSTEPVTISARLTCASPLASVQLFHRLDNAEGNAPWANKPMQIDNNGHGSAELTEYRVNRSVVQFYVQAVATNGRRITLPRQGATAPALYVVDDQKVPRDLRLDRFVVSAFDLGAMANGNTAKYGFRYPRLSNHRFNMTFISNEEKVFYGGSIRISGSPFTRGSDLSKAKWDLPGDRPFRGRTKFYFDNDSNYHNRLCRYLLYQLGHVTSEVEWIRVTINGATARLKEDTEPVTGEFLERNFKNGNRGELYRFDDEWWFSDDWDRHNRDADWQYKGTDDPTRYRSEWQKKTRAIEDDYTALIAFFKTYSANRYSQEEIERFLDAEAILQMAAVRGYINDWDSFTMFRGKNGYFFRRPDDGRFQFLQWDSDLAFRNGNYPLYSDRVASWIEKPYNQQRFQDYLTKLTAFTQSPQLATWFDLEKAANPSRPPNAGFYLSYFQQRNRFLPGMTSQSQTAPQPSQSPLQRLLRLLGQ